MSENKIKPTKRRMPGTASDSNPFSDGQKRRKTWDSVRNEPRRPTVRDTLAPPDPDKKRK
ncbi:hypothetical protein [Burkholderia gladioli]|uniref:hypothetical protein n=1 Tax=Burkholderia gladioli TaxID=28095 RepID=UPI003B988026